MQLTRIGKYSIFKINSELQLVGSCICTEANYVNKLFAVASLFVTLDGRQLVILKLLTTSENIPTFVVKVAKVCSTDYNWHNEAWLQCSSKAPITNLLISPTQHT